MVKSYLGIPRQGKIDFDPMDTVRHDDAFRLSFINLTHINLTRAPFSANGSPAPETAEAPIPAQWNDALKRFAYLG